MGEKRNKSGIKHKGRGMGNRLEENINILSKKMVYIHRHVRLEGNIRTCTGPTTANFHFLCLVPTSELKDR